MMAFVPKGFYALERAVLLLAKERDQALWATGKMTADEIAAYERLGETSHFVDLPKVLHQIELRLRHWKTGELPDDLISKRLESYRSAQMLIREALHAGDLRSTLLISKTGQQIENDCQAWAQENAMNWFDDGVTFISTGGTRKVSDGLYIPGLPDELNFIEEPNTVEATVLIEADSFSDWYYSGTGQMADIKFKPKRKGGRPQEYDWEAIEGFIRDLITKFGFPSKRLPSIEQMADAVQDEWSKKYDRQPSKSLLRKRISQWIEE